MNPVFELSTASYISKEQKNRNIRTKLGDNISKI